MKISIGKLRGIQQCISEQGTFTCLALDHRQNLRIANPVFKVQSALSRFKLDVTAALSDLATAILLDPEVSAAQAIAAGLIPKQAGLVVSIEATGYGGSPTSRSSQVLPGWSVEKARRMGASMVKLLVYFHPDSPSAPEIEDFVRRIVEECNRSDISLMLEPLTYSPTGEKHLSFAEKQDVIIETARRLVLPGVDVLKVEFPYDTHAEPDEEKWKAGCTALSKASRVPWILLSAAVDFETYLRQVEIACRAGASGCAVGRAVWQEAITLDGKARNNFLESTGRERLTRLAAVCAKSGKSITDFYTADAPYNWYKTY